MLAIARALVNAPRILLLDEPTEGLAPVIVDEIVRILGRIRESGVPVLLVEQNLAVCEKLADRHYVLEQGRIVYAGSNADFRADRSVRDRYLALDA
jgi:branched-chain amino acid transport system ATP-binding protein